MKKILQKIAEEIADSPVDTIESLMLSFTALCVSFFVSIAVIVTIFFR